MGVVKMKTYIFAEKNGNAVIHFSIDEDEDAARETLGELVSFPLGWRLSEVEKD